MFEKLLLFFGIKIKNQEHAGIVEGTVSVVANLIIFAIKLTYGLMFNSISLIADAIHSLSDLISSFLVIAGAKVAAKPPDEQHPFGHGRVELVVSIIVATLLLVAGLEFIADSIEKLFNPAKVSVKLTGFVLIVSTILFKEVLARFSFYLGEKFNSKLLIADGHHHRSDSITTVVVVISLACTYYGYTAVDGIAGIIVAFFIIHSAWELIKDSSGPLLGEKASNKQLKKIAKMAMERDGVIGVHDIVVHDFGNLFHISLHVELHYKESLCKAHEIADTLEKEIMILFPGHIIVHIDPVNPENQAVHKVKKTLNALSTKYPALKSIKNLRLVGNEVNFNIVFDIPKEEQTETTELKRIVKNKFPQSDIAINKT
jgi:cation diffusion facilitator family transporter